MFPLGGEEAPRVRREDVRAHALAGQTSGGRGDKEGGRHLAEGVCVNPRLEGDGGTQQLGHPPVGPGVGAALRLPRPLLLVPLASLEEGLLV